MSKSYTFEGKNYYFNNSNLHKLVEEKSSEDFKGNKSKLYRDIAYKLSPYLKDEEDIMRIDAEVGRIKKWAESTSGPSDKNSISVLAEYFNVPIDTLLSPDVKNKERKNMENVKNVEKVEIKKFNNLQKTEFIKIKNLILDYIYSYYSPYMSDLDLQLEVYYDIISSSWQADAGDVGGEWMERILSKRKPVIDVPDCFSEEEHKLIKEASENEERYNELKMKTGPFSFVRENNKLKIEYDGLTEEEQEFIKKYDKGIILLNQYRRVKKYGAIALIRQEIDKLLSVLPLDVHKKLVSILNLIPDEYWVEVGCIGESPKGYNMYDINDAIDVKKCEDYALKKSNAYEQKQVLDMNGNKTDKTYDIFNGDSEDRRRIVEECIGSEDASFIYSANNKVLNIHKIFNDIITTYFD